MKELLHETLEHLRGAERLGKIPAPCRSIRTFHIIFQRELASKFKDVGNSDSFNYFSPQPNMTEGNFHMKRGNNGFMF